MRWRIGLGEDRGLGGSQVESVRAVASSIGCGPRTGRQDRPSPGLLMKQISLLTVIHSLFTKYAQRKLILILSLVPGELSCLAAEGSQSLFYEAAHLVAQSCTRVSDKRY